MIDAIKELIKKLIDLINKLPVFIFKVLLWILIIMICMLIVVVTIQASFSNKIVGTCIEADEFGTKNDRILAQPNKNSEYMVNNSYKHEQIRQKITHTDLGLSLNGDPITINITGQWTPWLYDYIESISKDKDLSSLAMESNRLPDNNFFCALEKYSLIKDAGMDYAISNKVDENEFYYIRNYYKSIAKYKNEKSDKSDEVVITPSGSVTVAYGKSILFGEEELPERQKECWITRGAGLYLGSYGINGKTQPTSYHHLIASKMICSKQYWFDGKINNDSDIIVKYRKPVGVDYDKCKCRDKDIFGKNEIRKCDVNKGALKNEDLGTCSIYANDNTVDKTFYKNANVTIECDCKQYENNEYNYANFKENYFDVNYHLSTPLTTQDDININKQIIDELGGQIIYNIDLHEKLLYAKNVENVGYIIASSMEKFANACYKIQKNIDGNEERNYKSYFQYGPKYIYKYSKNLDNIKYSYGEKIKMFIADKYYKDNNGFYNVDIISGIDLDDVGSVEGKLKEIEFFLLGTPNPGQDDDRTDGVVAKIFNNILNSTFVDIVRIIMVFMVVMLGFGIIFGFGLDKNGKSNYLKRDSLIKLLIKIVVLTTILSPNAFHFFNKYVINFFINGTIGIIDLAAKIFTNSFMESEFSLINKLEYINTSGSLSRNFAIIDEILAFFESYAVTAKAISFFFALDEKFFAGCFISASIFLVLIFYVAKLLHSIVPFIFTILQLTLILPMAPICLALSLIKQTEGFLKQWISTVLSKCLQLISFFIAFYFCTSIINNFIKSLLNFKVCFVPFGDYIMSSVDDSIDVTSVADFFQMNWIQEIFKQILNLFTVARFEGLPSNWFIYYCINLSIVAALVYLFDTITHTVMDMVGGMLNVDGASGSGGSLSKTEKFGLRKQMSNFIKTTGLANLQKESGLLSWTRNIIDLSEGDIIKGNLKNAGKKIKGTINQFGDVIGQNTYKKLQGQETHFGKDIKKLAGTMIDNVIGGDKAKGSIFDAKTWGAEGSRLDHKSWGENKHNGDFINRKITQKIKNKINLNKDKKEYKKENDDWVNRAKTWVDDPNNYIISRYSEMSDKDRFNKIAEILNLDKKRKPSHSGMGVEIDVNTLKLGKVFNEDTDKLLKETLRLYRLGKIDEKTMYDITQSLSDKLKDSKDNFKTVINAQRLNKELADLLSETAQNNKDVNYTTDKIDIINKYITTLPEKENSENNQTTNNTKFETLEDNTSLINETTDELIKEDTSVIANEDSGKIMDNESTVIIGNNKPLSDKQDNNRIKDTKTLQQNNNTPKQSQILQKPKQIENTKNSEDDSIDLSDDSYSDSLNNSDSSSDSSSSYLSSSDSSFFKSRRKHKFFFNKKRK